MNPAFLTNVTFGAVAGFALCPNWSPFGGTPLRSILVTPWLSVDLENAEDAVHGRKGEKERNLAHAEALTHVEAVRSRGVRTKVFLYGLPNCYGDDDAAVIGPAIAPLLKKLDGVAVSVYDTTAPVERMLKDAERNRRAIDLGGLSEKPVIACVCPTFVNNERQTGLIDEDRLEWQIRAAMTLRPAMIWVWSSIEWRMGQATVNVDGDHGAFIHQTEARELLRRDFGVETPTEQPDWSLRRLRATVEPQILRSFASIRTLARKVAR